MFIGFYFFLSGQWVFNPVSSQRSQITIEQSSQYLIPVKTSLLQWQQLGFGKSIPMRRGKDSATGWLL
jgi:hypothetical protein